MIHEPQLQGSIITVAFMGEEGKGFFFVIFDLHICHDLLTFFGAEIRRMNKEEI